MVKKIWFTDEKISIIMRKLLEILVYLKSKSIIHRDIKPANILFVNKFDWARVNRINSLLIDNFCLVDFGLATKTKDKDMIYFKCGTPGFLAPEILSASFYTDFDE